MQLAQPYYLGNCEVTQYQYEKVMGINPSSFSASGQDKHKVAGEDTKQHPVEMVSFVDAADFCIKLSKHDNLKPVYSSEPGAITLIPGDGYRLPTEAEWEFSCRAGTNTAWFCGEQESVLGTVAWFGSNSGGATHPVGQLKANPFGLYDVHGNVWEWCQDWYDAQAYSRRGSPTVDPRGPDAGAARVLRGGDWHNNASHCRSALRIALVTPRDVPAIFGFRLSVSVDAARQTLKVAGPALPKSVAPSPSAPANASEKLPAIFTNSLGMEFVKVPKGTGWLGGGGGKPGEQKVEFADDFYLGKYEVTQEEWEKVTGLNPSAFSRNGAGKDAVKEISDADLNRFPVEMVSWDDCQLFLERLNKQAKETGWVYRLPTEAEWEYACRGGPVDKLDSAFDFYFAKPTNSLRPEQANFALSVGMGGLQRTCKVGSYQSNLLGLYDMHGNVWEWCNDTIRADDRLAMGGSWAVESWKVRSVDRHPHPRVNVDYNTGLRLARVRVGADVDKSAPPSWTPPFVFGQSPFDKLDAAAIPPEERVAGQPQELVAVIGSHARRHWGPICAVAINDAGTRAATANWREGKPSEVIVWDVATLQPLRRFTLQQGSAQRMRFVAVDSRLEIVGAHGARIQEWDIAADPPNRLKLAEAVAFDGAPASDWLEGGKTAILEDHWFAGEFCLLATSDAGFQETQRVKILKNGGPAAAALAATEANIVVYITPEGKIHRATVKNAQLTDDQELPVKHHPEFPFLSGLSRDGKSLVLIDEKGLVCWDISEPIPQVRWRTKEFGQGTVHFSPCNRWVALRGTLGQEGGLFLSRNEGPELKAPQQLVKGGAYFSDMRFTNDGNRLVHGGDEGFIRLWDLSGEQPQEIAPFEFASAFQYEVGYRIRSVLESARGRLMLSRFDMNRTNFRYQLWDLNGDRPQPVSNGSTFLDPVGAGPVLRAAGDRWVHVPSINGAGAQLFTFAEDRWQPSGANFGDPNVSGNVSPDGSLLVVYAGSVEPPDRLEGWDLTTTPPTRKWSLPLKDHPALDHGNRNVWFSQDGRWFATQSQGDKSGGPWKLVVWRNSGAQPEVSVTLPITFHANLYRAALSPDGRYLAHTSEASEIITVLDVTSPQPREIRRVEGNHEKVPGYVTRLAFHPDGQHLAYGSHLGAGVLDVTTGQTVWEWKAPGPVNWLDWAPDGRQLFTHNDNKTIYVLRLPQFAPTPFANDPDRAVAERVLSLPGEPRVVSVLVGDQQIQIKRIQDLPTGPFHVWAIEANCPKNLLTDFDLSRIGKLSHLSALHFTNAEGGFPLITDHGIEVLSRSPAATRLEALGISPIPNVTDVAIPFFDRFVNLGHINIDGSQLTDAGVQQLHLPKLRSMSLSHSRKLTPAALQGMGIRSPLLNDISLYNSKFGDVDCSSLAQWPLHTLSLSLTDVSDRRLESICRMSSLVRLGLDGNPGIHDQGVMHLKSLEKLENLGLSGTAITDNGCDVIADHTSLTNLRLSGTEITDAGIAKLSRLGQLQILALDQTAITDASVESLAKIQSLQMLYLQGCKNLTAEGVRKLRAALPKCKIESDFKDPDREVAEWGLSLPGEPELIVAVADQEIRVRRIADLPKSTFHVLHFGVSNLPAEAFTDRELSRIGILKHLRGIAIEGVTRPRITDQGLESFSGSPAAASIKHLGLGVLPSVTDASITHINRLRSLTHLHILGSQVTNTGIKQLALPSLMQLGVDHGRITPEGLNGMAASCPKLISLSCGYNKLEDADLSPVLQWPLVELQLPVTEIADSRLESVGKLVLLERLELSDNASTHDEGLKHLIGLNRLSYLGLRRTSITDASLESLAKLTALESLNLWGCKNLTEAGVRKLQAALPKCKIESDYPNITALPAPAAQSDRELAAWLLSKPRMTVELRTVDGTAIHLTTGGTMPAADFSVFSIGWEETAKITDEDLARIGRAQGLFALSLGGQERSPLNVTGKGLDALFSPTVSRTLQQLHLHTPMPQLTHADYRTINRATRLSLLGLGGVKPPAGGSFLTELRLANLTNLSVGVSEFEGGILSALAEHSPDLGSLMFQGMRVTPADIAALKRFDLLESLGMDSAGISDADMAVIGSLTKLKKLHIRNNPAITSAGVQFLANCQKLTELTLSDTNLTDAACDTISALPELEVVLLDGTRITDKGLERLTSLSKLQVLVLVNCKRLTDAAVDSIAKMTALKQLQIQTNPQLTEAAIRKLQAALPKCQIVSDFPAP